MTEQDKPKYNTGGIVRGPVDIDAVPSYILNVPGRMSDEDFRRLERRWREKHTGTRNAHRVTYLGRHPWPWWKRAYYRTRRWLA